jgi:hypothetical protein
MSRVPQHNTSHSLQRTVAQCPPRESSPSTRIHLVRLQDGSTFSSGLHHSWQPRTEYKTLNRPREFMCTLFDPRRLFLDPPLEPASFFSMGLFKHDKGDAGDAVDASHSAKANTYNFYVVFFSALGSFTYGYNSSIIGAVFGLPSFFAYFDISLTGPNAKEGNEIIGGKRMRVHWHCRRLTMRTSCQWSVRWGRHYWCSHCQLDPQ